MKQIVLDQEKFDGVTQAVKMAAPLVARQQAYEQATEDVDIPEVVEGLKMAGVVAEADVDDTINALKQDPSLALKLLKSASKMGGKVQVLGQAAVTTGVSLGGDDKAARDNRHLDILAG